MTDQIISLHNPGIQYWQLQALTDLQARYLFYLIALGWAPNDALDYVYAHRPVEKQGTSS